MVARSAGSDAIQRNCRSGQRAELSIPIDIRGMLPGVRVTILSGGVGGARFTLGVLAAAPAAAVTVIANVGDDLEHWDLHVSPDVDTVLYTLSGRVGELGWGVRDDTRGAMGVVAELGGAAWFILGDRDVGLHVVRTARLRAGEPLSVIVADVAARLSVPVTVIPATDGRLRTVLETDRGALPVQDWLVRRRAEPRVSAIRFDGAGVAPAPGVLAAISGADRVLLAPSNPFISLDPILAVGGVRDAVTARRDDVVAVSPIIAGRAVKGPLGELLDSLGHDRSALGVARYLAPLAATFVLDHADALHRPAIEALGMRVVVADTLMRDPAVRAALARTALAA